MILALLIAALLLLGPAPVQGAAPEAGPDAGCRSCHDQMAPAMPPGGHGNAASCIACHLGDGQARRLPAGHAGLIANPSALDQAQRACGPCHPGRADQVRRSPMATAVGVINQTRFLWGAQEKPEPRFAVRGQDWLKPLPAASGQAADDLLRRRCLRCHLWTPGADMDGARRSAGCAACHRAPASQGHGLTRKVAMARCLACHAGCGAGAEYVGRIPRDEHHSARFLAQDPQRPHLWQGRSWRPMRPDLHHQAGMACIDCHPAGEVMGDGQIRAAGLLHVGVRCTSCHGRPGQPPSGPMIRTSRGQALRHLRPGPGGWLLTTKLEGRRLKVPSLPGGSRAPVAHRVSQHQRLACHACHSALNPADWGTQALLEKRPGYQQWEPIAAQGDPQLLELIKTRPALPSSRDWLNGQTGPGIWLLAPFWRRYEWRVYGLGPDGRVMLLAPRFAWVLASPGPNGQPGPAQVARTAGGRPGLGITPWHSHSTSRATVGCADCHGRAFESGLGLTFVRQGAGPGLELAPGLWQPQAEDLPAGLDFTRVVDRQGRPKQVFLVPGARPFSAAALKKLLRPGKEYTRWLLKALEEEWDGSGPPQAQAGQHGPGQQDQQAESLGQAGPAPGR